MKIPRRNHARRATERVGGISKNAAPASRPVRGSIDNPIRPRNRRPWIAITAANGTKVGEKMADR